eukprot:6193338-Pleurochrysis_carterae.AAC.4
MTRCYPFSPKLLSKKNFSYPKLIVRRLRFRFSEVDLRKPTALTLLKGDIMNRTNGGLDAPNPSVRRSNARLQARHTYTVITPVVRRSDPAAELRAPRALFCTSVGGGMAHVST